MDKKLILEYLRKVYLKFLDASQTLLFFVAILLIIYMFIAQPHEVTGSSMHPTFKDKELLLSFLLDSNIKSLKHGDVIVFHSPVEEDKLYIKRVIAKPGDTIQVKNGKVILNGKVLDESKYLNKEVATYGATFLNDGSVVAVPKGHLFVMGDNRSYSSDSRAWGFLAEDKLIGRSIFRFLPLRTFTLIQRNPY